MIVSIAVGGFVVSAMFGALRLLKGPSLADRVIALDVVLLSVMGAIAVSAAERRDLGQFNLLVVIAIVGFTATVAASRFIENGGTAGHDDSGPGGRSGLAGTSGVDSLSSLGDDSGVDSPSRPPANCQSTAGRASASGGGEPTGISEGTSEGLSDGIN